MHQNAIDISHFEINPLNLPDSGKGMSFFTDSSNLSAKQISNIGSRMLLISP